MSRPIILLVDARQRTGASCVVALDACIHNYLLHLLQKNLWENGEVHKKLWCCGKTRVNMCKYRQLYAIYSGPRPWAADGPSAEGT